MSVKTTIGCTYYTKAGNPINRMVTADSWGWIQKEVMEDEKGNQIPYGYYDEHVFLNGERVYVGPTWRY